MLDALRDGVGAEAVGLFDDDRADLHPSPHATQLNLWEAFGGLRCVDLDWSVWHAQLKAEKRFETVCACGAEHRVIGTFIHERWALLLVLPAELATGAAASIASGIKTLAERLPPGKALDPNSAGLPEADSAFDPVGAPIHSAPVWWVRNIRH